MDYLLKCKEKVPPFKNHFFYKIQNMKLRTEWEISLERGDFSLQLFSHSGNCAPIWKVIMNRKFMIRKSTCCLYFPYLHMKWNLNLLKTNQRSPGHFMAYRTTKLV